MSRIKADDGLSRVLKRNRKKLVGLERLLDGIYNISGYFDAAFNLSCWMYRVMCEFFLEFFVSFYGEVLRFF